MTDTIKISVLICTYNRCTLLKQTLESVAAQTLSQVLQVGNRRC